jgi:uncharacterized membrane protein
MARFRGAKSYGYEASQYEPAAYEPVTERVRGTFGPEYSGGRAVGGWMLGAAIGAGVGLAALLATRAFGRTSGQGRVVRLEKSVQIGRPRREVFEAWSRMDELPRKISFLESVRDFGLRSHWAVNIDGKRFDWDAETTQEIEGQAIGWKSISGPKHTGRINFAELGGDTLVHVVINYQPPMGLGTLFTPAGAHLEQYLEQALRDFKSALEGKGQEQYTEGRATGTYGSGFAGANPGPAEGSTQTSRFGGSIDEANPVDYTRPPEKPY